MQTRDSRPPANNLVIQSQQLGQLRSVQVRHFEDRVVDHLRACLPRECSALTEEELRAEIGHGIQKATSYGFDTELEVCKYINLLFVYGRDFDLIKEPWASACRKYKDHRRFREAWDEAYDALIGAKTEASF